jgi:hypothetical protein
MDETITTFPARDLPKIPNSRFADGLWPGAPIIDPDTTGASGIWLSNGQWAVGPDAEGQWMVAGAPPDRMLLYLDDPEGSGERGLVTALAEVTGYADAGFGREAHREHLVEWIYDTAKDSWYAGPGPFYTVEALVWATTYVGRVLRLAERDGLVLERGAIPRWTRDGNIADGSGAGRSGWVLWVHQRNDEGWRAYPDTKHPELVGITDPLEALDALLSAGEDR